MNRDSNNLSSEELSQIEQIREYGNQNPFEYELSKSPPGTIDYFLDVESYHNRKFSYLKKIIDYNCLNGKKILKIGCFDFVIKSFSALDTYICNMRSHE